MVKMGTLTKKQFILGLYLLLFALIGPAMFWLLNNKNRSSSPALALPQLSIPNILKFTRTSGSPSQSKTEIQQRLSSGDKILITADTLPAKQAGVQAFAQGDYKTAVSQLRASLSTHPDDPEARIYLNNAIALLDKQDMIHIAVSVPIGGNLNIAREILRGVAQFQDEINQGEANGKKHLQILIANDDNDPAIAQQVATAFIDDSSILAVIGHNSSETSLAAAPLYQKAGLVMMSPTSAGQQLSKVGKYIFRTTPSVRVTASTLAQYIAQSARKEKVVICAASKFEVSQSFKDEFIWSFAQTGNRISDINCDFSAPNFKADDIPSQAIANGADALLLVPSAETINQALEVIQSNQKRLDLFGNQTLYSSEVLKNGQLNASGIITAVPWSADAIADNPFPTNAQKLWGTSPSWRTAMAYDAALVLREASKFGTTRQQLQQALLNPGFSMSGATGMIQFLPTGDRITKGFLVQVQPGNVSGTGYDFVALHDETLPAIGGGSLPTP